MTTVFGLLSWLNLIGGIVTLLLSLVTANLALFVLAMVTLAQAYAWDLVEKLSTDVEELKAHSQTA